MKTLLALIGIVVVFVVGYVYMCLEGHTDSVSLFIFGFIIGILIIIATKKKDGQKD